MKKMNLPERFQCEFHTHQAITGGDLYGCNVAILDLQTETSLKDLRICCKEGTLLILCADFTQASAFAPEALAAVDEVWIKPLSAGYVAFQWGKLIQKIKLQKDYYLSQSYLNTCINSIPELVWFKDIRGAHLKVNDAFCHAVGKTKEDVEGRGHYYIWDLKKEEYEKGEFVCLETEEIVIQEKKTCLFDEKVKSKHGLRQFKTYKSPIFSEAGEVIGTVGIAHDVTDLENMTTELEIILRSMPFAIMVKNNEGSIINVNEKFELYFGTKKKEVLGINYEQWKGIALKDMKGTDSDGFAEATLSDNGQKRILEIHEEPIFDVFSNIVGQLCICRDTTKEHILERQILRNSNTDFLTGLYNRRYFYEYVALHRGKHPISLIYVDLDYFKMVNDTFGHQAGDDALISTARLLNKCFPEALIARLGGDEFLITFMGEYSIESIEEKARDLLAKMEEVFHASKHLDILSASIGIAQSNDPDMKIDTLISQSDIALYEAKRRGRAQYCVYSSDLYTKK